MNKKTILTRSITDLILLAGLLFYNSRSPSQEPKNQPLGIKPKLSRATAI